MHCYCDACMHAATILVYTIEAISRLCMFDAWLAQLPFLLVCCPVYAGVHPGTDETSSQIQAPANTECHTQRGPVYVEPPSCAGHITAWRSG